MDLGYSERSASLENRCCPTYNCVYIPQLPTTLPPDSLSTRHYVLACSQLFVHYRSPAWRVSWYSICGAGAKWSPGRVELKRPVRPVFLEAGHLSQPTSDGGAPFKASEGGWRVVGLVGCGRRDGAYRLHRRAADDCPWRARSMGRVQGERVQRPVHATAQSRRARKLVRCG